MLIKPKRSFSNWIPTDLGEILIDYPTREQAQVLQDVLYGELPSNAKMIRYAQLYIKFTLKDWKDQEEKCVLVNNELEDDLWWRIVEDVEQATKLWKLIDDQLQFTQNDKKKLE